ncbi:MAG: hypothetical protein B0W54_18135 [Cellvibrio sp. 79]|nr:MAG: hypothetical protein B0W54_18135 [Cellvibrio sp. 79]
MAKAYVSSYPFNDKDPHAQKTRAAAQITCYLCNSWHFAGVKLFLLAHFAPGKLLFLSTGPASLIIRAHFSQS